jgi:hypothetical protein
MVGKERRPATPSLKIGLAKKWYSETYKTYDPIEVFDIKRFEVELLNLDLRPQVGDVGDQA